MEPYQGPTSQMGTQRPTGSPSRACKRPDAGLFLTQEESPAPWQTAWRGLLAPRPRPQGLALPAAMSPDSLGSPSGGEAVGWGEKGTRATNGGPTPGGASLPGPRAQPDSGTLLSGQTAHRPAADTLGTSRLPSRPWTVPPGAPFLELEGDEEWDCHLGPPSRQCPFHAGTCHVSSFF